MTCSTTSCRCVLETMATAVFRLLLPRQKWTEKENPYKIGDIFSYDRSASSAKYMAKSSHRKGFRG